MDHFLNRILKENGSGLVHAWACNLRKEPLNRARATKTLCQMAQDVSGVKFLRAYCSSGSLPCVSYLIHTNPRCQILFPVLTTFYLHPPKMINFSLNHIGKFAKLVTELSCTACFVLFFFFFLQVTDPYTESCRYDM